MTAASWTRTVTATAGIVTGTQFDGQHTLAGNANGFAFSQTVSTTGGLAFDASGALVSGQWTIVRPAATIATSVADGSATITLDVGNDGSVDRSWTFTDAQLDAAAG